MNSFAKVMLVVSGAGMLLAPPASHAVVLQSTVHSPKDCPSGLTIKSKAIDGKMLEFDVSLDADQIANVGNRHKERVGAYAFLSIGLPDQPVASVKVSGAKDGKRIRYQFRLSPSAASASELQLALSLLEEDGSQTVGGGVILEIQLAGFAPAEMGNLPTLKK